MADDSEVRRELERVLRRNKQLRDSSSLALIELDPAGAIVSWNRQAEAVFGWSEPEIVGRHWAALVPESARAHVDAVLRALVDGEVRHSRHTNRHKDGRAIVCQWHNAVLRGEDGAVDLINCEVRDVTAEEALRKQQRLMQALASHSPVGIFAKSPAGDYLYANPEFARSVDRPPEAIVGRDDFFLFEPAIAEDIQRHDAAVLAEGGPLLREDAGVGPDADRIYSTLKFPLRGDDGEVVAICGIINDLTEVRRSERERAALQQRVIASQQQALAEMSTPLIPVAHGVLVMPLIGKVDPDRAERIMEVLLAGVAAQRARAVILDITGVRAIDTTVADSLLRAARSVELLGAEAILTGVGPTIAQTLVGLGVDLRGLVTLGDLHSGVRHAMRRTDTRSR
jgi:rsbT co-antagonist protein RsbR